MTSLTLIASGICDVALALVYPQPCAICGGNVESRHDGTSCADCWRATRLYQSDEAVCWKCGALSQVSMSEERHQQIRCGRCDEDSFTVARAGGTYARGLRASIIELKRQPHVPRRVIEIIHHVQQREPLNDADLIVPVPLHVERERERGFNQAAIIARELARVTQLPLDEHSLVRRIHTERHRAGMDAKARRKSVENAFSIRRADLIEGKRVLLIDDVFTTGATVSACAAALARAGAKEILVLTIARAEVS